MIKMLGATLLVCGATVIGFLAASELSVRVRVLSGFLMAFSLMRAEIEERLSPINEVLEKISEVAPPPLDAFFKVCAEEKEKKKDVPLSVIWSKNLLKAECLKLKTNEREVLSEAGSILGRFSAAEQTKQIGMLIRRTESFLESAENDKKRLGGVYTKLGFICGMALVIIFI